MIGLIQNKTIYEYDIRSLILAFMLGEKIELTDHVDSIYDFILDVDYKDQEIAMNLYKKGELEDEIQLFGDYENKKIFKNQMKRGIYQLFSKALDKQLPWGTLTGIRPTKIAFDGYEKGESSEEIIHRFQKDYLASEEKARLCTETVQKEKELLKAFPYKEGYSLYIGIPFCPSTCLYCSFTSYSIDQFENIVQDYLEALLKELDFVAKTYANKELQTMYIGGGTPTSLKEEDLEYLLCEVNKRFPFSKIQEITVEAGRPDSLNLEKLKILKKYGVTRISINPQSMNDKTLKLIGRNHFAQDIKEKFNLARQAGIGRHKLLRLSGAAQWAQRGGCLSGCAGSGAGQPPRYQGLQPHRCRGARAGLPAELPRRYPYPAPEAAAGAQPASAAGYPGAGGADCAGGLPRPVRRPYQDLSVPHP